MAVDSRDSAGSMQELIARERELAQAEVALADQEMRVLDHLSQLPVDPVPARVVEVLSRIDAIEASGLGLNVTALKTAIAAFATPEPAPAVEERQAALAARRQAIDMRSTALKALAQAMTEMESRREQRLAELEKLATTITVLETEVARALESARQQQEAARRKAAEEERKKAELAREQAKRAEEAQVQETATPTTTSRDEPGASEGQASTVPAVSARDEASSPAPDAPTGLSPIPTPASTSPSTSLSTSPSIAPSTSTASSPAASIPAQPSLSIPGDTGTTPTPAAASPRTPGPQAARRISRRRRVKLAPPPSVLEVDVEQWGETNFFTGFEGTLDSGGLFVETFHNLPVGHELDLNINVSGRSIRTRGRVVFVRDVNLSNPNGTPGAGLSLPDVSDDEREHIEAFFEKRPPLFFVIPNSAAA